MENEAGNEGDFLLFRKKYLLLLLSVCLTSKNLPIQLQKKMGIKHLFLLRMSKAANVKFVSGFCKFVNASER